MKSRIVVTAGLAGVLACASGETVTEPELEAAQVGAAAPRIWAPIRPTVDGIVRDGLTVIDNSTVQALHVPSFEDRGFIEFLTGFINRPVLKATLVLEKYASMGPYPLKVDLYGYRANGRLEAVDWARGTFITSFQYSGDSLVKLDVTAKVQAITTTGANYVGFVLRVAEPSDIPVNGPFVAFGSIDYRPPAKLRVITQ